LKKGNPIIKKLTLFNMVNLTSINSLFMLELPGILSFGVGRFHSWKEQIKVEPMYSIVMASIKTWATLKGGVGLKLIVLFVKKMADHILSEKKIINIKSMYPLAFIDVFLLTTSSFYKKWIDNIANHSLDKKSKTM
jgi:hypothetical protein